MYAHRKSPSVMLALTGALVAVALLPATLCAQELSAGVPVGALWFSKEPLFVGENVSVFTLVYNSANYTLSGTIALLDGTTTLSLKEFSVSAGGAAEVIAFPLMVTAGDYSFSAVITQNEFKGEGGEVQSGTIVSLKTAPVKRFVDHDTDGDGIGNMTDSDDDGDRIPDDSDERPLVFDKKVEHKEVLSIATTTQAIAERAGAFEAKIHTAIPEPFLSKAVPIFGFVEDFRVTQAKRGAESIDDARERIIVSSQSASTTPETGMMTKDGWGVLAHGVKEGGVFTTPFEYVKLFFAILYYTLTSSPYVFYPFILIVVYQVIRAVLRLFFT